MGLVAETSITIGACYKGRNFYHSFYSEGDRNCGALDPEADRNCGFLDSEADRNCGTLDLKAERNGGTLDPEADRNCRSLDPKADSNGGNSGSRTMQTEIVELMKELIEYGV